MTTYRFCILLALLIALSGLTACSDETAGMEPTAPGGDDPADDPIAAPLADGVGQFRHMDVLAFTRGLNYRVPAGVERTAVEAWLADHLDVNEGDPGIRDHDPDVEIFRYDLDLTAQIDGHAAPPDDEAAYLHFAEETVIQYRDLSGNNLGDPVTFSGSPSDGPPTPESRLRLYMWDSYRWAFDPADATFRDWQSRRLIDNMGLEYDGVFLDEHSPGFRRGLYMNQNRVLSGGAVREFDGLRPSEANLPGKNYNELDRRYSEIVVDWLTSLRSALDCADKFMLINPAQYYWIDLSEDEWTAAGGVTLELVHTPFDWSAAGFGQYAAQVRRGLDAGVRLDLNGRTCPDPPAGYVSETYADPIDRYRMWRLAAYYYVRGEPDAPGRAYFDPSFCGRNESLLDYESEWIAAYESEVGDPLDDGAVVASGRAGCSGDYRIYRRDYTYATVLVRPQDAYGCEAWGPESAVDVELGEPMRQLHADGTLGAPQTTATLCNSEAVILIREGS